MNSAGPETLLKPLHWVDVHGDYLYRFAVARVRRRDVAAELLQETFVAALAAQQSFLGNASERTWLTGILKRKIVDWLRIRMRRSTRELPLPDPTIDEMFDTTGHWVNKPAYGTSNDPSCRLEREELQRSLTGCLDKLPTTLRTVFVLRYIDEQETLAVTQQLNITANHLWVLLHRARLRLWSCLRRHGFAEDQRTPSEEPTE